MDKKGKIIQMFALTMILLILIFLVVGFINYINYDNAQSECERYEGYGFVTEINGDWKYGFGCYISTIEGKKIWVGDFDLSSEIETIKK